VSLWNKGRKKIQKKQKSSSAASQKQKFFPEKNQVWLLAKLQIVRIQFL
jgi:hypothetical protein